MNTREILYPLTRAFTPTPHRLAPAAALLGLGARRRRRQGGGASRLAWLAAGVVIAGAAGALLMAPARRRELGTRLLEPLQKTGGGVGKWLGQVLGKQVGAHPVATTKAVQGVRNVLGSSQPES